MIASSPLSFQSDETVVRKNNPVGNAADNNTVSPKITRFVSGKCKKASMVYNVQTFPVTSRHWSPSLLSWITGANDYITGNSIMQDHGSFAILGNQTTLHTLLHTQLYFPGPTCLSTCRSLLFRFTLMSAFGPTRESMLPCATLLNYVEDGLQQ